jgi:hypothetical protein
MASFWDDAIQSAGDQSIEEFSEKASSLIKLTNQEIQDDIPVGVDHKQFANLMAVVNDASKSNQEKAQQIRATVGFAEIAANLLTKLT